MFAIGGTDTIAEHLFFKHFGASDAGPAGYIDLRNACLLVAGRRAVSHLVPMDKPGGDGDSAALSGIVNGALAASKYCQFCSRPFD
jgi:hypothetical protein